VIGCTSAGRLVGTISFASRRWRASCDVADGGVRLSEHMAADGGKAFHHACRMGPESIVSMRREMVQIGDKNFANPAHRWW
jgi:hypothetical protein